MQKRRTYPTDPFDMLLSTPEPLNETPIPAPSPATPSRQSEKEPNKPKASLASQPERRLKNETFGLSVDLMDWARNAVYFTPGLTLSGLVEESLRRHLKNLEEARGEPFPTRPSKIKTGRPIGS